MAENLEQYRHFSFYIGGKKVATATGGEYGGKSGDEAIITDDGYSGHTSGAMTTSATINTIEPVRQSDSAVIVDALINKKYIKVSESLVAGGIHTMTMRCVNYNFTSERASGKITGKFDFEGGKPEIST